MHLKTVLIHVVSMSKAKKPCPKKYHFTQLIFIALIIAEEKPS